MTTRHISHHLLSWLIAFLFILSANATAQTSSELPDSLVYSIEMYKEALNEYKAKKVANELKTPADSFLLMMSYYPWCSVFDSRSIHRVSTYDDGIYILKELVQSTNDTIQKQLYLDELMYVYDVWCEYADTINKQIDAPFSKTLILSEKVRTYENLMPVMYNLWWDSLFVTMGDTLKTKMLQENALNPEVCRLYDYMRVALYSQESKENLYYDIPYLYFRLSHARLRKNQKLYSEQYTRDFDSVDIRYSYFKTLALNDIVNNNIVSRHNDITKMYDEASGILLINSSGNWREKEEAFRNQLYDKMDYWDLGMEEPDPQFLNRVIRGIGTDSSEVYIEALECYLKFIVPSGKVNDDNLADYKKKRIDLYNVYFNKGRYDDAISILKEIIGVERDDIAKAEWYFLLGGNLGKQGKSPISNYKRAVRYNPNYGNALYQLAIEYSKCSFTRDAAKDRIKYFLCLDLLQKAKNSIENNSKDPKLKKYNNESLLKSVNEAVIAFRQNVPSTDELFMMGLKSGTRFDFPKGTYMDGESTIIR